MLPVLLPEPGKIIHVRIKFADDEIVQSIRKIFSEGKSKVTVDMDQILGHGGEGLVLQSTETFMEEEIECAVKMTPYKVKQGSRDPYSYEKSVFGRDFTKHLDESKEYKVGAGRTHINRLKYLYNTIVTLNGHLFHITGR